MKPLHKSNAGQIVNMDEKMKLLSDYIKQVQKQETPPPKPKTFDEWLDEPFVLHLNNEFKSRRQWWDAVMLDAVSAAREAWEACEKTLSSKA